MQAFVRAVQSRRLLMIVDAEAHRGDGKTGQWKAGDMYDIAVTLMDPATGSTVAVLYSKRIWKGKLDRKHKDAAVAAMQSRPDALLCAYGRGPEWQLIKEAGRELIGGSDGVNLCEAFLQVMPDLRRAASAEGDQRWSMSQNLWVPEVSRGCEPTHRCMLPRDHTKAGLTLWLSRIPQMGLRRTAYHEALPDCITEGVVVAAIGRALSRPHSDGGCS